MSNGKVNTGTRSSWIDCNILPLSPKAMAILGPKLQKDPRLQSLYEQLKHDTIHVLLFFEQYKEAAIYEE